MHEAAAEFLQKAFLVDLERACAFVREQIARTRRGHLVGDIAAAVGNTGVGGRCGRLQQALNGDALARCGLHTARRVLGRGRLRGDKCLEIDVRALVANRAALVTLSVISLHESAHGAESLVYNRDLDVKD